MRDENQPAPTAAQRAHDLEQPLSLQRREGGGRLVENDDAAVERQRLEDFNKLALADAQPADRRIEPECRVLAEFAQQRLALPAHLRPIQAPGHAKARQHDVLQHAEIGRERGLLRHQPDAGANGIPRAAMLHPPPLRAASPRHPAGYAPEMTRDKVDFPAPFAPTSACTSPAARSKATSDSA